MRPNMVQCEVTQNLLFFFMDTGAEVQWIIEIKSESISKRCVSACVCVCVQMTDALCFCIWPECMLLLVGARCFVMVQT